VISDVKVTGLFEPLEQRLIGPAGVISAVGGTGFTITSEPMLDAEQPLSVTVTVYVVVLAGEAAYV
jgi:hypothetical protein